MVQKSRDKLRNFLKYSAQRAYFGELTGDALSRLYRRLEHCEYGTPVAIKIGKINGDVICRALWREMSLNPGYFGTVSPFVFNGANNIFRFVETQQTNPVVESIRFKLIYFMQHNAGPNRQWCDELKTDNSGYMFVTDKCGDLYRALQLLRDCIKVIAAKNVSDYDDRGKRDAIIDAVVACGGTRMAAPQSAPMTQSVDAVFRDMGDILYDPADNYYEMLQINQETAAYRSAETVEQTWEELQKFCYNSAIHIPGR